MQPWIILFALTLARTAMAFQFQSVAALSTQIEAASGLGFASIGALSGAFLLPGMAAALLGGWAGHRFGDFRVAVFGLFLMAAGAACSTVVQGFEAQLVLRVVAGIGAVALNVMLNKMAGDWFQGRADLPVAMSILVSSWPAGLALAVFTLPWLAVHASLPQLLLIPAILSASALVLLLLIWQAPPLLTEHGKGGPALRMTTKEMALVLTAGLIWGIYNVGFIAAVSWSPQKLQDMGLDPQAASATASLVGWAAIVSVAVGGWLARMLRRPEWAALGSFALTALALGSIALSSAPNELLLISLGLALGPAAGMIMTLPIEATRAELRAKALGLYWATYYALMGVGPAILGLARETTGTADTPLLIAAVCTMICFVLWFVFRTLQRNLA